MDSKLPKNQDFETHGGNHCEPMKNNHLQGNSVNTFNYEDNNVSKISQEQLVFVLRGSVHEINPVRLSIIQTHLQKTAGDTELTVNYVEQGSIKITGSLSSLEKLQELFAQGRLLEVLGIPIEYVYFLRDEKQDEYYQENQESALVRDILENGAFGKDLTGTDLKGVDLRNADLSGSDLSGANIAGANLEGANLLYANLKGTIIDSTTKLDKKWLVVWQIVNQQIDKQQLIGVDLSSTYLINVNLSGANLENANFSDANLEGSNLAGANLENANFSNTNLEAADLNSANLNNANLNNADLR